MSTYMGKRRRRLISRCQTFMWVQPGATSKPQSQRTRNNIFWIACIHQPVYFFSWPESCILCVTCFWFLLPMNYLHVTSPLWALLIPDLCFWSATYVWPLLSVHYLLLSSALCIVYSWSLVSMNILHLTSALYTFLSSIILPPLRLQFRTRQHP